MRRFGAIQCPIALTQAQYTGVKPEFNVNGHSVSLKVTCFMVGKSRRGTPGHYIIMLALTLKFPKT